MRSLAFWGVCALFVGCAFGPGEPFATVMPSVSAQYVVPADRSGEDGFARLSSDYEVRVDVFELELDAVALQAQTGGGGGGGGTFDPANPPPGYSLCHGGHCHSDEGALVSYEDIQAELDSGGASSTSTLITLPLARSFDLVAAESFVPQCNPDCELPQTTVTRLTAGVTSLRIEGVMRDRRATKRLSGEVPFRISFTPTDEEGRLALSEEVEIPADRQSPPFIGLSVKVLPTAQIFDAVDFAALDVVGGVIELSSTQNEAARESVLAAFGEEALSTQIARSHERGDK